MSDIGCTIKLKNFEVFLYNEDITSFESVYHCNNDIKKYIYQQSLIKDISTIVKTMEEEDLLCSMSFISFQGLDSKYIHGSFRIRIFRSAKFTFEEDLKFKIKELNHNNEVFELISEDPVEEDKLFSFTKFRIEVSEFKAEGIELQNCDELLVLILNYLSITSPPSEYSVKYSNIDLTPYCKLYPDHKLRVLTFRDGALCTPKELFQEFMLKELYSHPSEQIPPSITQHLNEKFRIKSPPPCYDDLISGYKLQLQL